MNLFEFTQLFCRICFRNFSFRDFTAQLPSHTTSVKCPHCQHIDLETVYKVTLTVKDKSLFNVPQGVKCVLFTADGVCDKFFNGLPPMNMYRDSAFKAHIEKYIRHIVRFNVYLDAVVEKKVLSGDEIMLKLVSCRLKPQQ